MKRKPQQHGLVRTYNRVLPSPWNPKPETRPVQRLNSSPASGLFSNVPSMPGHHSKVMRKCGRPHCLECHLNPVGKSKDKTKGTQKVRTSNLVLNPRLITWRVVDKLPSLNFSGFSATGILDHLYNFNDKDGEIDDPNHDYDHDDYNDGGPCGFVAGDSDGGDDDFMANFWSLHEKENGEIEEYDVDNYDYDNDDDDDAMSYCDVGFMLEQTEEDEGWCLLRDM